MVTVAMPIYYFEQNIRKIIGVAGIDIKFSQVLSYDLTEN